MGDAMIKTVDEARLLEEAQRAGMKLIERAGFDKLVSRGYRPWWPQTRLPDGGFSA